MLIYQRVYGILLNMDGKYGSIEILYGNMAYAIWIELDSTS